MFRQLQYAVQKCISCLTGAAVAAAATVNKCAFRLLWTIAEHDYQLEYSSAKVFENRPGGWEGLIWPCDNVIGNFDQSG